MIQDSESLEVNLEVMFGERQNENKLLKEQTNMKQMLAALKHICKTNMVLCKTKCTYMINLFY